MCSSEELVALFERAAVPLARFHHREHLTVALWYAHRHSPEEALCRMRVGLQALLSANGKPPEAYCEPTTRFWMQFASGFVQATDKSQPFPALLSTFLEVAKAATFPAPHGPEAPRQLPADLRE